MLTVYIVSAIVAGVLMLLSMIGGFHGFEHEFHAEHDFHAEHGGTEGDTGHGLWIPIISLRFWIYFFGGFGLTGLLITFLTAATAILTLWIAIVVGLAAGFSMAIVIRALRVSEASSGARETDILGAEAQVLVPIRGKTPGRIRCVAKGETIDFLAICDDPEPIPAGSSVIVVAFEDSRALVMPRTVLFSDNPIQQRTT
ncbi:MAG TPA: NfeD family protein [Fimbriimonadaceae bacterium]|nr:NfeD family protein [Fimbriimonadaceae bacterium]